MYWIFMYGQVSQRQSIMIDLAIETEKFLSALKDQYLFKTTYGDYSKKACKHIRRIVWYDLTDINISMQMFIMDDVIRMLGDADTDE